MKKLYVFGDSFTKGCGCLYGEEYYIKYKKDKDKIWCEILSDELNIELVNKGVGLNSNDKIIDSVIREFDSFNESDIILIQKTFSHRFDIPNLNNDMLITISPNPENLLINFYNNGSNFFYSKSEIEHLEYVSVLFDSYLFIERQNLRFDFLKKMILNKNIKCFIWDINNYFHLDRIIDDTKGKIVDYHWSFNGHKEISIEFCELIKNNNI